MNVQFFVKEEWRGGDPNKKGPYVVPKGTTVRHALEISSIPILELLEYDLPDSEVIPGSTIYLRWHKRQPINKARR